MQYMVYLYYALENDIDASLLHAFAVCCDREGLAGVDGSTWDPPSAIFAFVYCKELAGFGVSADDEGELIRVEVCSGHSCFILLNYN